LENLYKALQKSVQLEMEGQFLKKKVMHSSMCESSYVHLIHCWRY